MNEKNASTCGCRLRQLLAMRRVHVVIAYLLFVCGPSLSAQSQIVLTPSVIQNSQISQSPQNAVGAQNLPGPVPLPNAEAPANQSLGVGVAPSSSSGGSQVPLPVPATQATPSTIAAPAQAPSPLESAAQAIAARQQLVQDDAEKTAEFKEPLIKLYQQALLDLKVASDAQKQRLQWTTRIAAAPRSLEEAKSKRTQTASRATISDTLDYMSFDEVQKELQELQAKLTTATEVRSKLSEQVVAREKRRKELPQLLSDARTRLEGLAATSPTPPTTNDDALPS